MAGSYKFPDNSKAVVELINLALQEDKVSEDITTQLTVSAKQNAEAQILAKQDLVVCGLPLVELIFAQAKCTAKVELATVEGEQIVAPKVLANVKGRACDLLSCERTILNFLQRMSGVATLSRSYSSKSNKIKILDTRKTTPGWRELEKYAVSVGGGTNHRATLADLVLVKNNHVDLNGGDMAATLSKVFADKPINIAVEVEVRNEQELRAALPYKPERIMLDNMSDEQVLSCVKIIRQQAGNAIEVEASGGITLERISRLAELGIDCISVGALTTQATNRDISFRIKGV